MSDIWFDDQEVEHLTPIYSCLKAQKEWQADFDIRPSLDVLDTLVAEAKLEADKFATFDESLNAIIDLFYGDWAFSGTNQAIAESKLNTISYALAYRTGSSFAMAMILDYVLNENEICSEIVVEYGELTVHVRCSEMEGYFIDPVSGHQSWYIKTENGSEEDNSDHYQLIPAEDLIKLFIGHQKWAFISEKRYIDALRCVEMLMEMIGDDPYERRDRGYLLKQLDCHNIARHDFEFFINECPDDPAIELIQYQLDEMDYQHHTFH
ncbi:tetratricopeptide repeat protein [Pseudoalteromonas tunicata]|uniref:tetratricopeptide repeat protein n=1 Tax=Pseudoalteromonas tunicata TaxID=314281 RepID=UPI00273EF426|nr:tetratricopeptide repeat protein [Pseudoalteromonas tunicata]MDP4985307.1 tetratricopeptide repeat protein [Pseudoalteromonas tunicata]MDP5215388.1 tetratricopeptide repeat protein [Pseudoalteromonas tunicata]